MAEAVFEALNAEDLESFLAWIDEDVAFTSFVAEAEGTTFRGHEGVRLWWDTVRGAFTDLDWELLDIQGTGERAIAHVGMTGTLGGIRVNQMVWQAGRLREGKMLEWSFYRTEAEALEAAGLSG